MSGSTAQSKWHRITQRLAAIFGPAGHATLLLRLENQTLLRRKLGHDRFKLALALLSLRLGKAGCGKISVLDEGFFAVDLGHRLRPHSHALVQDLHARLQHPISQKDLCFTPILTGVLVGGPVKRRNRHLEFAAQVQAYFSTIKPQDLGQLCPIPVAPRPSAPVP